MGRRAEVLGDGPAALAVAIALARRGWVVGVVAPRRRAKREVRIDVLEGSALPALARLGVSRDDMLAVARPCPGTWSRWGAEGAASFDYLATPHGPAWAVDRAGFEALLCTRATTVGVTHASGREPVGWRILASGRLAEPGEVDDSLIALLVTGEMASTAVPVDGRLMIEATPHGWAYGVVGPNNRLCLGVITDAEALAGTRPPRFATDVLCRTERIQQLLHRLGEPLTVAATPLPCRFLPLQAGETIVRIGDAQTSFDPLAGRGLWEAIRGAEQVANAIDEDPERLTLLSRRARENYSGYLARREAFYRAGRDRFGTGFWDRRLLARTTSSASF
jgi:2-polyprenyl-6-methoxyphenol hydroxylase-like FAD-dependent oxidoreductase